MPQNSLVVIDNRVLKEDYCNYDLIARYWNEEYQGRIWKNKGRVAECNGNDLDEIMAELKSMVDTLQTEKRQQRGKRRPGPKDLAEAFRGIEPKLSRIQKMMLSLQFRAPGHLISVKSLIRLGDYASAQKAFGGYLDIATRLCHELAYTPANKRKTSSPGLTVLCQDEVNGKKVALDTALTLRPEIVAALELLGWARRLT